MISSPSSTDDHVPTGSELKEKDGRYDIETVLATLSIMRDLHGAGDEWRAKANSAMADVLEQTGSNTSWEEAEAGLQTLRLWGVDGTEFAQTAQRIWPKASVFREVKSA